MGTLQTALLLPTLLTSDTTKGDLLRKRSDVCSVDRSLSNTTFGGVVMLDVRDFEVRCYRFVRRFVKPKVQQIFYLSELRMTD